MSFISAYKSASKKEPPPRLHPESAPFNTKFNNNIGVSQEMGRYPLKVRFTGLIKCYGTSDLGGSNAMTNKELLISRIDQLSDEEISSLLDTITLMTTQNVITVIPDCPYCASHSVIRYGHKCGKQRFSANPVKRLLCRPPIRSCQIHISRQMYGPKSLRIPFMAMPLTIPHEKSAVPTRRLLK